MGVNFQTYKDAYFKCDSDGKFVVFDKRENLEDFDGESMELYKGEYIMVDKKHQSGEAHKSDCLIKKFSRGRAKLKSYSLLKNIKHPSIVSVENFYDEDGQPRFVLSWLDGSISAWTKSKGIGKVLKSSLKGRCPTPTFRQMIIDICSGMEHLFKEGVYPIKIGVEDIFIQNVGRKDFAKLLICGAKQLDGDDRAEHEKKLWAELRDAVKKIFDDCGEAPMNMDPIALKFFNYIGKCSATKLEQYPHAWSETQKAKYLLWVMSIDRTVASPSVQGVGIGWPGTNKSGNLPSPLRQMIIHDETRGTPSNYDVTDPYEYLRICKDIIKHWLVLPKSVKEEFANVERFVQKMDKWEPTIWCILYEIFQ